MLQIQNLKLRMFGYSNFKFQYCLGFSILCLGFFAHTADAATYYVATNGSDSNAGTITAPFRTIQKAADIVAPGDTVIVRDGVYTTTATDAVATLRSGGTASQWITFKAEHKWGAILDGQNNYTDHGFVFYSYSGQSYTLVEGFELRNFGSDGFDLWRGPNIVIYGNHIHHMGRFCTDTPYGRTGLFVNQGVDSVIIEGNIIHDIGRYSPGENGCNPATQYYQNLDHGIYADGSNDLLIRNNIFYNNIHGWAIHVYPNPSQNLRILNNTFAFPSPYRDGHIIFAASITNALIANNIFYQPNTYALANCCGVSFSGVQVNNNIVYGGTIGVSGLSGITFSGNKENTDPKLVNSVGFDFQLTSSSPAINAGTTLSEVTVDFDGITRPQGSAYDIGAYEYVSETTALSGDINGDKIVNSLDWSLMSAKWLTSDVSADLNKDGAVNSLDWSVMSSNWLKTI